MNSEIFPATTANPDDRLRLISSKRFNLIVGLSVVVLSFAWGLASGLTKKVSDAHATADMAARFGSLNINSAAVLNRLEVPPGTVAVPIGNDMSINGRQSEMLTFITDRGVQDILQSQVKSWESRGLYAFGATGQKRGMAVAFDQDTGERYSISAWIVPPSVRKAVSYGKSVQGIISVGDAGDASVVRPDESTGEVPGVPVMPGGKGGTVVSSLEADGRSQTGSYTNPGTVADSVAFYREILSAAGWQEMNSGPLQVSQNGFVQLTFFRGAEETVLFIAPVRGEGRAGKTLVTVTLGPRQFSLPVPVG